MDFEDKIKKLRAIIVQSNIAYETDIDRIKMVIDEALKQLSTGPATNFQKEVSKASFSSLIAEERFGIKFQFYCDSQQKTIVFVFESEYDARMIHGFISQFGYNFGDSLCQAYYTKEEEQMMSNPTDFSEALEVLSNVKTKWGFTAECNRDFPI